MLNTKPIQNLNNPSSAPKNHSALTQTVLRSECTRCHCTSALALLTNQDQMFLIIQQIRIYLEMQHYTTHRDNFDAALHCIGNLHLNQTCLCGLLPFSPTKFSVIYYKYDKTFRSYILYNFEIYTDSVYSVCVIILKWSSLHSVCSVCGKGNTMSMNNIFLGKITLKSKLYKNTETLIYMGAKTAYKLPLLLVRNSVQICLVDIVY